MLIDFVTNLEIDLTSLVVHLSSLLTVTLMHFKTLLKQACCETGSQIPDVKSIDLFSLKQCYSFTSQPKNSNFDDSVVLGETLLSRSVVGLICWSYYFQMVGLL